MTLYAQLRSEIQERFPDLDIEAVDLAYEFSKKAHEGQTRYSGEPYIIHPVEATRILLQLNPDLHAIQACLLHDVTEDTERTLDEIEEVFGSDVASLVQGLEKLAIVKIPGSGQQDEKWKKMFLAMANDVRIVFIKLSDRLHNMRTLGHVPEHKQKRIAKESLAVHAAIASRLGIYQIKSELEDLCFKYLYPEEYSKLAEQVDAQAQRQEQIMNFAVSQVEQLLFREGVQVHSVKGRMKHVWSLYQKMLKKDLTEIAQIYDLFAIRVVLPDHGDDMSHLYSTLGLLHREYLPLQDRFKDYVAVPKPNGYRSLHTTLLGVGDELYDEPTEIQIRTVQMHREAELGVASHWTYKANVKQKILDRKRHFALHQSLKKIYAIVEREPEIEEQVRVWVESYQHLKADDRNLIEDLLAKRGISEEDFDSIKKGRSQELLRLQPNVEEQLAWLKGLAESEDASSELDLYPDKIFVLTPNRDVIQLPKGSTPIDFAYSIHTEVGNHTSFAKVNGRIVSLEYLLKNGDVVEMGTRNNAKPSRYWLSVAKTHSARTKIKNWFNKQDRELHISRGRDLLNEQLTQAGKGSLDDKLTLLKDYGGKQRSLAEREQILESVGLGSMTVAQAMKSIFPEETLQAHRELRQKRVELQEEMRRGEAATQNLSDKVMISGYDDLSVILSACCKPKPGENIIGYVTRGRAIRVHRQSCIELDGLEGARFVSAVWKTK